VRCAGRLSLKFRTGGEYIAVAVVSLSRIAVELLGPSCYSLGLPTRTD